VEPFIAVSSRGTLRDTELIVHGGTGSVANSADETRPGSFGLTHDRELFFTGAGWRFETSSGEEIPSNQSEAANLSSDGKRLPTGIIRMFRQPEENVHIIRAAMAGLYGKLLLKAERTWVMAMPHTMFIMDRILADSPIKVHSDFEFNNGDHRLTTKVAAETKLVLRRNAAGMKFFQVCALSGGTDNGSKLGIQIGPRNDLGHPYRSFSAEDRPPLEVTASRIRYASSQYRIDYVIVYAASMDGTDEIRDWHIIPITDRHFHVEPPAKSGGYSLELAERDAVIIRNHSEGRAYLVHEDVCSIL